MVKNLNEIYFYYLVQKEFTIQIYFVLFFTTQ